MPAVQETIDQVRQIDVDQYKYGFETVIDSDTAPKGLNEDTIRMISAKKNEPEWMLEWRLDAFKRWLTMEEPTWARVDYPKIDFQDIYYYSAPKGIDRAEVDRRCRSGTAARPTRSSAFRCASRKSWPASGQQSKIAVDAVFDSVSVVTTFKEELAKAGVIFCRSPKRCASIRTW
jgi:Fe-S cluster assembly protein SufB